MLPIKRAERLFVELAATAQDVRAAQSLRFRVFGDELGAKLKGGERGLDIDAFDGVCRHLLVREVSTRRIVGCTRLLTADGARQIGRFYAQDEFELGPVARLPGRLLEVGRTCIAAEYRQGAAIAVLWSGLAEFIHRHGCDFLFGCASVPLGEDDRQAAAVMDRIRRQAMVVPELRVTPRVPIGGRPIPRETPPETPEEPPQEAREPLLPPLLRAYIRLGAKACGEPCRDPDFAVADILMLLRVTELNPAYSRHFIERVAADRPGVQAPGTRRS